MPKKIKIENGLFPETESTSRLAEIKAEIQSQDAVAMASVWLIGKLLTEAKSLCKHGEWSLYVAGEVGYSMSYAARLMRIYSECPDGLPEGAVVSTLLCTLSLDEMVRGELDKVIKASELTSSEADRLVKKCQADESHLAKLIERAKSPEECARIKAELRAELEPTVKAEIKADVKTAKAEAAELDTLNKQLQKDLERVQREKAVAEKQAAEAIQFKAQLDSVNVELIEARRSASASADALELSQVKLADALAKKSDKAIIQPVRVPVEKIVTVPPADYEDLKAEIETLRSQNEQLRIHREVVAQRPVPHHVQLRERIELLEIRVTYLEGLLTEAGIEFAPSPLFATEESN